MFVYLTHYMKEKMYTLSKFTKSRKLRTYLGFHNIKDIDVSYISQLGKEFEICGCLHDLITYNYSEFCKKILEKEEKLLFLHGVTRLIRELFGKDFSLFTPLIVYLKFYKIDIDKNERFPKEKIRYKGGRNK